MKIIANTLEIFVDNKYVIFTEREVKSAIEKQMPKKAEHDDGVWSICPNCGGSVANDSEEAHNGETSYCDHCGQAIDWSDTE